MDCREAQEAILDMFDGATAEINTHVAGCAECSAFLARQSALDRELAEILQPPALSPNFRAALRERTRREPSRLLPHWLPDVVHLVSCAATTLVCAALLPVGAGPVIATGALVTAGSYVFILMMRMALEY